MLRHIEEHYECSGFCYMPLFSITRSIKDRRPQQECFANIIDSVFDTIGGVSLLAGGMLLLTFILSLFICGGFPSKVEEEVPNRAIVEP